MTDKHEHDAEAADAADAKAWAADLTGRLDDVIEAADAEYGESNPGRVEQLRSALSTARMAVEHLATETPYRLS